MNRILLVRLVVTTAVAIICGVLLPASASAAISSASPSVATESQSVRAAAAVWCNRTLWRSGKRGRDAFIGRLSNIKKWVGRVDKATDAVALALAAMSVGTLAVPAAIVKLVAKFGDKELIEAVANRLITQANMLPRAAQAGALLQIKCKAGFAPYPSFSAYT